MSDPSAAGGAETPCATFEPAGEKALDGSFIPYLTLDDQPLYRRVDGSPCPDCGVETPEAAVEALRELRSAIFRITETSAESPDHQLDEIRHAARQGWTPPGTTR